MWGLGGKFVTAGCRVCHGCGNASVWYRRKTYEGVGVTCVTGLLKYVGIFLLRRVTFRLPVYDFTSC